MKRGHSLMEMVIVLCVLAGLTALAWPMLKSPLDKMHLKAAAQEVSSELSKTRIKAMQSGVTQVFQVQINTGKFQSSPMDEIEVVSEESDDSSPLNETLDNIVEEKELPSGICFEIKEESESDDGWTNIAVFYPNGDNNNALISLSDKSDLHIEVKLNGLTGAAKIGEVKKVMVEPHEKY